MRVITGTARGVPLRAPPGQATRPTSDLVKGMIFSMLAPAAPFERVADLFAGSGALGIEALSRGAESATFVERQPRACQTIRQNLRAVKLEAAAEVICATLPAALDRLGGSFDLVLIDPPYVSRELPALLARLVSLPLLAPGAVVVTEHAATAALPDVVDSLKVWKRRRQGDSAVTLYTYAPATPAQEEHNVGGNPAVSG